MKTPAQTKRRRKSEDAIDPVPDAAHIESTEILDEPTHGEDAGESADQSGKRRVPLAGKPARSASFLERVESAFRMVSLLAISASVVLTAYQFYQGRIDEKKERSVVLMNTWQASDEREAFARLSAALETRLQALDAIPGQVTPAAMRQLKFRIGEAMMEDWSDGAGYEGWSGDVDSIFNFYSEIEFCIRAGLCDAPLLTSYFGEEAISFWEYFRPYAETRRKSFYPDYGAALEAFVEQLES